MEGKPIINTFYALKEIHDLKNILKHDELYVIIGMSLQMLDNVIKIGMEGGITNHDDFNLSYIPKNHFFKQE